MNNKEYKKRIIDEKIKRYLRVFGAVCIEGPKYCGKTWTSTLHSKSKVFLGDPTGNFQNRNMALVDPSLVLSGEFPRLIDEWQEVPSIWDAVRFKVDESTLKGQFILTGSSTPNHKGILHSGAGRIAKLRMNTMSLYESGDSNGKVSLKELFKDDFRPHYNGDIKLLHLAKLIVRGGWPGSLSTNDEDLDLLPLQYISSTLADDIYRIDNIKRNSKKMELLLRSLARNESTTTSNKTLKRDIKNLDEEDIDIKTIADYLDILKRLFITDNIPPFDPKFRSSLRVKQSEKLHFSDPSFACGLLGLSPTSLINDLETFGFMFESLCLRDLKIYAEANDSKIYHYQDYKNKEIDAVIQNKDGKWIAIEIKLGANQIDVAAKNLLKIKKTFEEEGNEPPHALCVVCGLANAAYKREDDVYVIPITSLKD